MHQHDTIRLQHMLDAAHGSRLVHNGLYPRQVTVMDYPAPYLEFVSNFNARQYHACIAPLEVLWFAQRDNFHKALIRMCVGLNQIGLGLDSGPRFLLRTARELLEPYGERHIGLDLTALRSFLRQAEAVLDTPPPRTAPPYTIVLEIALPDAAFLKRKT